MSNDTIYRQDAIEAINTWDKFGVDGRSRVVRWHEGLEPYVRLRDVVMAIGNLSPAQPEPSIPLSWIEKHIEWLKSLDNEFANLATIHISVMVEKWRGEQDDT